MAESIMCDKTEHHNMLLADMQVVDRHFITSLAAIVLSDGRFKPFLDLPTALQADKTWTPDWYSALCDAIAAQVDQAHSVHEAHASGQRQLTQQTLAAVVGLLLVTIPVRDAQSRCNFKITRADKFPAI